MCLVVKLIHSPTKATFKNSYLALSLKFTFAGCRMWVDCLFSLSALKFCHFSIFWTPLFFMRSRHSFELLFPYISFLWLLSRFSFSLIFSTSTVRLLCGFLWLFLLRVCWSSWSRSFFCLLFLKQALASFIIEKFCMIYFSPICFGMLLMISESPGSLIAIVHILWYFPHAVPNSTLLPL